MVASSMMSVKTVFAVFFLSLAPCSFSLPGNSSDIDRICWSKNSCEQGKNSRRGFTSEDMTCKCDGLCANYSDCCLDSSVYVKEEQRQKHFTCNEFVNYRTLFIKAKCPETWNNEEVSAKCLSGLVNIKSLGSDPIDSLPVTSYISGITYANYYCAACNNDSSDIEIWKARMECTQLDYTFPVVNVQGKPFYSKDNGSWYVEVSVNSSSVSVPCDLFPFMPGTVEHFKRDCTMAIDACSSNWTDDTVEDLCHSYMSIVYERGFPYRNYHCAICNHVSEEHLSCVRPLVRTDFFLKKFHEFSFALLFDFKDSSGSNRVGHTSLCRRDEIWDSIAEKCRNVLCGGMNERYIDGKCTSFTNNKKYPAEVIENNSSNEDKDIALNRLECDKILLSSGEYLLFPNATVYVQNYSKFYEQDEYIPFQNGILVCKLNFISYKFSPWMGLLTLVGLGLSCISLLIYMIAFAMVPDLQNISGKNMLSLCVALFIAYLSFIFSSFGEVGETTCKALGSVTYAFFMASFCWMNILAFDVWRTLQLATSQLRVSSGKQVRKFIVYSVYAWLVPVIWTLIVILLDVYKPQVIRKEFLPDIGGSICWFSSRHGLLIFFAVPFAVMMITNVVLFFLSARLIAETTHLTSHINTTRQQTQFKLYARLALMMGLTWISGIIAGYLNKEVIWYIFVVLQTLQGVFIFVAFVCTKKVSRTLGGPCLYLVKPRLWPSFTTTSSKRDLACNDSNNSHLSQTSSSTLVTDLSKISSMKR